MDKKTFLAKIPKEWNALSKKELDDFGYIKSEDFELLGAFVKDQQIIFFNKYPFMQNFLHELKEAFLDVLIYDKSGKNKSVSDAILVEMGEFNGQNFLFNVSKIADVPKLSLQIFCEFENQNYGVVTAIDYEQNLSFKKLTEMPTIKQILSVFV